MSMRLSAAVFENLKPVIQDLEKIGIHTHQNVYCSSPMNLDFITCISFFEFQRRSKEMSSFPKLEEFEKNYFGPEVGNIRRHFNELLFAELDFAKPLLDMGFGSTWWKDMYWPRLPHVYATEVAPFFMTEAKKQYADASRYTFAFTPTGLTEFADNSMEQVLSSSIIGYILPLQADLHLQECWRVLKPGGKLIITRVKTRNVQSFREGYFKYLEGSLSGFETAFSQKTLLELVQKNCPNFTVKDQRAIGFRPLFMPWGLAQKLYRFKIIRMLEPLLCTLFPFFSLHQHLVVEKKPLP